MTQQPNMSPDPNQAPDSSLWQVRDFVDEQETQGMNPFETVARLYRGQWLKTACFSLILGVLTAFAVFNVIKPVFESQGLVRVVAKEPKILYADNDDSRLRLYDAFVSAEATYIQSQQVLARAHEILIEAVDAQETPAPRPKLQAVADALEVKKLKGLIAVSAKSSSPGKAQQIVNALLRSYTELHTRQSDSRQILRVRELEVRVEELLGKQYRLNQQLLEVGEEYDASSLAKAHLTKVTQLEELDIRITELANTLVEMEATDGALDADTGDMEIKRATLLDRAMADMVFERAKRAAELEKLELRYMPQHPKVETLSASLKVIDEAIEARRRLIATLGKTGAITGADGAAKSQSLAELHALKRKLSNRRDELSLSAKELNGKLIQLKRINSEQAQISGMLAETRRILDQVRLESRNSLPGTVEVLARGNMPDSPAADKRVQFSLLAFVFGVAIGATIMLLRRFLSSTVLYSDDVKSLISCGSDIAVMPTTPDARGMASFFSALQLHEKWHLTRTNVLSVVSFTDDGTPPLDLLAKIAAGQGVRTLLVETEVAQEKANLGSFAECLTEGVAVEPDMVNGYRQMSFGLSKDPFGYSLGAARAWLQRQAEAYDLIIINTGVSEQSYSARILPPLSDITVAATKPNSEKGAIKRLASQNNSLVPLFYDALDDDPGLTHSKSNQPLFTGESNEAIA